MNAPKKTAAKIDKIISAWETLAEVKIFGGMTLTQFKAAVQPSCAAREQISTLNRQLIAALDVRNDADVVSLSKVKLAVKGVLGDPEFGPDSDLYEAMGYVRKSERKSGLTRKKRRPGGTDPQL